MKPKKNLLTYAARHLELPADVLDGTSRIGIIGTSEFSMEPHGGLLAYSQTEILLRSGGDRVAISGKNLMIKLMNERRIVITGIISNISLAGGSHE